MKLSFTDVKNIPKKKSSQNNASSNNKKAKDKTSVLSNKYSKFLNK